MSTPPDPLPFFSVGHSNRPIDAFVRLLEAHTIEAVVDVRRYPASRRLPQFHADALGRALDAHGIAYHGIPALGGRRPPAPDSPNDAWRHPNFRGYADHLATEEFAQGLFELVTIGAGLRTAMMCAEVLWWRCHRRLIADVLTVLGYEVLHLQDERPGAVHVLAPPARLVGGVLDYGSGAG